MAQALISLPTEERIILYLSDYPNLEGVYEAPPDITQKEIAVGVRVQRKHISRYLKKLITEGSVEEKTCHVQGAKQRMKCYCLSWKGMGLAKDVRKHIGNKRVRVSIDGKVEEMLVSEIDGATSVHLTLSDIVGEAQDAGDCLDMTHLEQIEERKRRLLDERTHRAEVYRNALAVAWRSGVLTPSEKQLIESLKTHLGITDRQHRSMEEQIINNIEPIRKEHRELLDDVHGLIGNDPTEREAQLIQMLKERFNL